MTTHFPPLSNSKADDDWLPIMLLLVGIVPASMYLMFSIAGWQ